MAHLTQFEVALVILMIPMLLIGISNFLWNISLKHYKDWEE